MFPNLRSFLDSLKREGQLVEVTAAVDPYLELPEIHRRVIEEQGPALLFSHVQGSPFPVVTNLFGTSRRVELATGPRPENNVKLAMQALDKLLPPKPKNLWEERRWLWDLARTGIKRVPATKAPVLAIGEDPVDLTRLPALTGWQEDGGPFITLPLVYTEHPDSGKHNLGMYRMQILGRQQTGMHWQIHKGGGFHHFAAEQHNRPLPVTVFLGGPPVLTLAAIAPLPEVLPELIFAAFLLGDKLRLAAMPGWPHPLVAEAEFIICGQVPPRERQPEGPFGDHYGYYSLNHDFPVLNVAKIYRRKDALYPATIVGKPRQEDYFIGEYLQNLLSPLFPAVMPGVKSLWTYGEAGFHSLTAAVVRNSYDREALMHAFRILGEGQLTLTKFLIVTDCDMSLIDFGRLLEEVLIRFRPEEDLLIINDTPMDSLDYTGRRWNKGSKAIFTGLGDPVRQLPRRYAGGEMIGITKIKPYCGGCLVISGSGFTEQEDLPQLLVKREQAKLKDWPLVVLLDDADQVVDQTTFLWTVFTRFDPAHDIWANTRLEHNKICYTGPVVIDARMKAAYPAVLVPQPEVVKLVSERWKEYFGK